MSDVVQWIGAIHKSLQASAQFIYQVLQALLHKADCSLLTV
jgi:hypothetical protein